MSEAQKLFFKSGECKWILLLCILAAVHVFVFSAAFPFFNNVDEDAHFDMVVKYAQGNISLGSAPAESIRYLATYHSYAFLSEPGDFPGGKFPPPLWKQPAKKIPQLLLAKERIRGSGVNLESSEPPLYYAVAGQWWNLCGRLGLKDGNRLYALRFFNIFIIVALIWLGYATARIIFPENVFPRLGVPALLAFMPQSVFYSINNDVLSPLTFGFVFLCLIQLLKTEIPTTQLGALTGLAIATTFLSKMSNLPLLIVAFIVIFFKACRLAKEKKWRLSWPSFAALFFCAALPMTAWMAVCKKQFGDFTGAKFKMSYFGWTYKPFAEWWHHPIFSPHGLWIYLLGQWSTFWQGELWWHDRPMNLPLLNIIYATASLFLLALIFIELFKRRPSATPVQRDAIFISFFCIIAALGFYAFLSIIYDFHNCFYPSRQHPYFTSGRLMLGALIPFLLLLVYEMDRLLNRFGNRAKFFALIAMMLFMMGGELAADWPVFSNAYNWFHL